MYQVISSSQFEEWQKQHPDHLIVDVREDYEFHEHNLGGINIPLGEVIERINDLPLNKSIVFCCKSGKRSAAIAYTLSSKYGKNNIYTLEGGIESLAPIQ